MNNMPDDLRWLAENLKDWPQHQNTVKKDKDFSRGYCFSVYQAQPDRKYWYSKWEVDKARQQLEDERMDIIARNGNDGLHYDSVMTPEEEAEYGPKPRSKYHVEIRPGVWVDVYDVLHAFQVINPGDQHAVKKMLKPGKRGFKDENQDRKEAIDSLVRAIELNGGTVMSEQKNLPDRDRIALIIQNCFEETTGNKCHDGVARHIANLIIDAGK